MKPARSPASRRAQAVAGEGVAPHNAARSATPPSAARQPGRHDDGVAEMHADPSTLRLWLRLLACSTQIETEIRRRLRRHFGTTLPRFDFLAQLHRHPQGLRMNELSRQLMVTGGSVTGLTDQLAKDGWVRRERAGDDRRAFVLQLTPAGRAAFERMASVHQVWIDELFGGLDATEQRTLQALLGRLRWTAAERATHSGDR